MKYLRVFAGFLALFVGAILTLPGVPGPGLPVMIFGLVLLSGHFAWARRVLAWFRRRWRRVGWTRKRRGACLSRMRKDTCA